MTESEENSARNGSLERGAAGGAAANGRKLCVNAIIYGVAAPVPAHRSARQVERRADQPARQIMDYGTIVAPVREYLHDMIGSTPQVVSDEFVALMDLYSRK